MAAGPAFPFPASPYDSTVSRFGIQTGDAAPLLVPSPTSAYEPVAASMMAAASPPPPAAAPQPPSGGASPQVSDAAVASLGGAFSSFYIAPPAAPYGQQPQTQDAGPDRPGQQTYLSDAQHVYPAAYTQDSQHYLAAAPPPPPSPPPPPAYSLRKVTAQFDFAARAGGQISFRSGEVLEVLRDSNGDGWLLARRGGEEGRIPEAYVTS